MNFNAFELLLEHDIAVHTLSNASDLLDTHERFYGQQCYLVSSWLPEEGK